VTPPQGRREHAGSTPPAVREPRPTTPASGAGGPLDDVELALIDAYWPAANYLSVGQIYLMDNPLLTELCRRRTSSRGCSGTGAQRPGYLVYAHLNRVIRRAISRRCTVIGPGHGGPGSWQTPT
jgi:xylulose-5-phosphate/fructose-6-phosphate phosphoketolase